jgi:Tol biopolymer transport system component
MKKIIAIAIALTLGTTVEVANADYTFGTPTNLGPTVNSSYADPNPSISADGLELYFESYRSGGYGSGDLYVSTRETIQDPWGVPVNLGSTINTSGYDITPCISPDFLELYFVSDRPGTPGGSAIWTTKRATRKDDWGPPVNLGPVFNSKAIEFGPAISSNGLELYFSDVEVYQTGGHGLCDLWMISRPSLSEPWGQPMNLGPTVNSTTHDRYPSISADGRMLFLASQRPGGQGNIDLWLTRRATLDDDWGTPVNLGPRVNTSSEDSGPSISADGRTLYFFSSRGGGYGSYDIWQVSIDPVVDLNGDGIVDCADMCIIVDNWGTDNSLCDIGPMPWGDGIVDVQDLIVLSEHLFEGIGNNLIERRISRGSDDAEEGLNAGYFNWNNSSDLELVHDHIDNGGSQLVGMTFRDITIMPGEVISSAYIEFVCDEIINGTADAYFLIWGHLTPNSNGFIEPFTISDRPKTDAKVQWEPDPWNAGGQKIQTVDIAPILQELIDQPGWAAGNAVEIIIGADPDKPSFTGVRCAESYEGSASNAPLLHIEISTP